MFFARVLLLPQKTSPLYKIGKFRHLLAYIGRFVFPIREPGRLYQNRESPGEIGRLERSVNQGLHDVLNTPRALLLTDGKNVMRELKGNISSQGLTIDPRPFQNIM